MKRFKHQPLTLGTSDASREVEVQREIDNFLRALSSYPDRFAQEPYLSFEEHLFSIVANQHFGLTEEQRH